MRRLPFVMAVIAALALVGVFIRHATLVAENHGREGLIQAGYIGISGVVLILVCVIILLGVAFSSQPSDLAWLRWACIVGIGLAGPLFIAELIVRYL